MTNELKSSEHTYTPMSEHHKEDAATDAVSGKEALRRQRAEEREAKWHLREDERIAKLIKREMEKFAKRRELEAQRMQRAVALEAKRSANRVIRRAELRAPHEAALANLTCLTSTKRIEGMLAERCHTECCATLEQELQEESPAISSVLNQWHRNAWIYNAHPLRWQTELFRKYIKHAPEGTVLTQCDAARWLKETYGLDPTVEQLFFEQYDARSFAHFHGRYQAAIYAWYFTPLENDSIPNVYMPVDDLLNRLAGALAIRQIDGGPGRYEVLPKITTPSSAGGGP